MKIICINGQGGVGKDSFVNFCGSERRGIFNFSMVDGVKDVARRAHWNGSKELKDRKFLSDLKDLLDGYNDFSFKDVKSNIEKSFKYYNRCWRDFSDEKVEPIFFIHSREPKDIQRWKDEHGARALIIRRTKVEGEYGNHADDQVFDFEYDYCIWNNDSLNILYDTARRFIEDIRKEEWESHIWKK